MTADDTRTTAEVRAADVLSAESRALRAARKERADLHHVLIALEEALAAPAALRTMDWALHLHDSLVEMAASFERHIAVTEAPGGLLSEIRSAAPRLGNGVERLRHDHGRIRQELADRLADVRKVIADSDASRALEVRRSVTEVLTDLVNHRQLGSDLVYEAYAVDIGVGD